MKNTVKVKYAFHPEYQSSIYFIHNLTENVQNPVIFLSYVTYAEVAAFEGCKKGL